MAQGDGSEFHRKLLDCLTACFADVPELSGMEIFCGAMSSVIAYPCFEPGGNVESPTMIVMALMSRISSTCRRLLLIVALFAMFQALLHTHAIFDSGTDHATAPTNSCVLCVSSATSLPAAAVHLPPPPEPTEGLVPVPRASTGSLFCSLALASRAPPQI
jgi:hypothetical protein